MRNQQTRLNKDLEEELNEDSENDIEIKSSLNYTSEIKLLETTRITDLSQQANDSKFTPDFVNTGLMPQQFQAPARPKTTKFSKEGREDFFRAKKLARSLLSGDSITPANNFPTTSKTFDLAKAKMELSTSSSSSLMVLDDEANMNDQSGLLSNRVTTHSSFISSYMSTGVSKAIKNIKSELDNCKNDESLHREGVDEYDELTNKSASFISMTAFDTTKNNETISFLSQSNLTPMGIEHAGSSEERMQQRMHSLKKQDSIFNASSSLNSHHRHFILNTSHDQFMDS